MKIEVKRQYSSTFNTIRFYVYKNNKHVTSFATAEEAIECAKLLENTVEEVIYSKTL